jgi:hypothetical protein
VTIKLDQPAPLPHDHVGVTQRALVH